MVSNHSYIACVRESTQSLPSIDSVTPFCSADDACLKELSDVLKKYGAISRFGISLLHSHFRMSEDEVLLEETDLQSRKQLISVINKADVPAGAIYMDRRLDLVERQQAVLMFDQMTEYSNKLVINKLQADLSLSAANANVLFEDVKRFIALCACTPKPLAPPRPIDRGWHQFILLTKDYAEFCENYCARYVHHQPVDPFAETKDYSAGRRYTRQLAERVFGSLSVNWDESLKGGDCTHNCGTGDVSSIVDEVDTEAKSTC